MPARLKSFELHGYKTFASRNQFIFSDGITAIVGPNGSGKSNIADALRWVLGEQSYGLLRGKKTEDMIFSGSENRPRAGMASATIIFDNSDGWLPIDFAEVGITRRAYRDGENEYLLNGQRVRLKDVSEILAKSGLAERTYTIIGQGLVDAALALKAEDRRRLFEEAAGIGLHRARREEAIKRLETTRRNLERVQDILAELQPRLRSLERQAKRAQEYNQLKDDLKVLLREWYGYHWHRAQKELIAVQIDAKQKEELLSNVQSNQLNLDQKLSGYRSQINEIRGKLGDWHQELTSLHQKREILSREQAVNNERSRSMIQQLEQLSLEKLNLGEEVAKQKDLIEIANQELAQLELELKEAHQSVAESVEALNNRRQERASLEDQIKLHQTEINDLASHTTQLKARQAEKETHINRLRSTLKVIEKDIVASKDELSSIQESLNIVLGSRAEKAKNTHEILANLTKVQDKLAVLEQDRSEILETLSTQKTTLVQIQAEINVLEDAEKNLTGYEEGARILLQAVKENRLDGAIGSLGNSLIVPEEYESAIAAILGEYIDSLIIRSIDQTDKALDLIKSETVRGSIFPLDAIFPSRPISLDLEKAPVEPENILGIAAKLIKAEPQIKPIVDLIFGQVIIVKDRKTARTILSSSDWRKIPNLRVVTLKGEMYLSNGPIIRGASRKGLLVRPRQRRENKSVLEQATAVANELEEKNSDIEKKISEFQMEEKTFIERYENAQVEEKKLNLQISQLELQIEKIQRSLQWHQDQHIRNQTDIDRETLELVDLKNEIEKLGAESINLHLELDRKTVDLANLPLDELQAQNTYWSTNTAVIEQALLDAKNRRLEKNNRSQQLEDSLNELSNRSTLMDLDINKVNEEIAICSKEEKQIAERIEELSKTVNPLEEQLGIIEREHNGLLSTDTEARQALRTAEQQYTQAKITLAHHQEAFETLRGRIEDDFGLVSFDYTESVTGPKPLPLNGMVEELPRVDVLSLDIEETIRQQKAQIRRMGAINPEAQNEYQEVKERFEFLTSQ